MIGEFKWPVRVYYEDTDAAGIVYHANYLRFMERARTEWLRELGFEQDRMREEDGIIFVIVRTDVRYVSAARFNQALVVASRLRRLRGASIEFEQKISATDGASVCEAVNTVGCVDAERLVPRRIPPAMKKVFERAQ